MNKAIVERIVYWNEKRYPQVYDAKLAHSLLSEEITELLDAETEVDALDALIDVYYVAIGALWKLGVHNDYSVLHLPVPKTDSLIDTLALLDVNYSVDNQGISIEVLGGIAKLALNAIKDMGLDDDQARAAILVVCDSNDSKTVTRTIPTMKANIDKGNYFVRPEARLQLILDEVNSES